MKLSKAIEKKKQLQLDIQDIIRLFEEETSLNVSSIDLDFTFEGIGIGTGEVLMKKEVRATVKIE
jgi:hypothetical protein